MTRGTETPKNRDEVCECDDEQPETKVNLETDDTYDLSFPLQKETGEDVDGCLLKDVVGRTVL